MFPPRRRRNVPTEVEYLHRPLLRLRDYCYGYHSFCDSGFLPSMTRVQRGERCCVRLLPDVVRVVRGVPDHLLLQVLRDDDCSGPSFRNRIPCAPMGAIT